MHSICAFHLRENEKKNRRAPDPEALYHRVDVLADLGGGARREAG